MAAQTKPMFETDFSKYMPDFKVPGVDVSAFAETQRKNFEAVAAANQLAYEGAQAVARRQQEIMRKAFEEAGQMLTALTAEGKPEAKFAKQAEAAKQAYTQGVANFREIAEMSAKSGTEAFEVINKRVAEALDEMKAAMEKAAKASK
jgi:phasin family protein